MSDPLELVFLDPRSAARFRKKAPWQKILDDARRAPPAEPSDPPLAGQSAVAEDRRDAFLILARGAVTDADGVGRALGDAVRDDGKLVPPLVLVAGELAFGFDELALLKAMVTTATPFQGGDEPLKAAADSARDLLAAPGFVGAPATVEAATARIRDAFGRVKRAVPTGYLESQAERAVLEQRLYQVRVFQGEPHVRALLHAPPAGAGSPEKGTILAYLSARFAASLPLFQRFGARAVAEVLPSADQYERHAFALRLLALARVVTPQPKHG